MKDSDKPAAPIWPAEKVEMWSVDDLEPYARNARTHPDEQIRQIMGSMERFGFTIPILVSEDSTIIAGHGRLEAAKRLGYDEVPVMVARGWSEEMARAYTIADNRLAETSEWDVETLRFELTDLGIEKDAPALFDLGFKGDDLAGILAAAVREEAGEQGAAHPYTRKIEAPIYEPTQDVAPAISEMLDMSKVDELIAEIEAADLPADVEGFLRAAAMRHAVFHYRNIAEFYAHADADVQDLMERSALVIIDFDKAIERGFTRLTDAFGAIVEREYPDGEPEGLPDE